MIINSTLLVKCYSEVFVNRSTLAEYDNFSKWLNCSGDTNAEGTHDVGRILVTSAASLVSLITIVGNLLVIAAFKLDSQLHTLTNYYLVSLAVSDFIVGFVSMPISTVYLLYGYWPLGSFMCDVWLSVDYAMTTASVANVFVISVDRFLSVIRPIKYRATRTPRKVGIMIAYAWSVALLLWPPWIIAWPYIEGHRTVLENDCYVQFLKSNGALTLVTSLVTFYIPVSITTVLYIFVYAEASRQKRQLGSKSKIADKESFTKVNETKVLKRGIRSCPTKTEGRHKKLPKETTPVIAIFGNTDNSIKKAHEKECAACGRSVSVQVKEGDIGKCQESEILTNTTKPQSREVEDTSVQFDQTDITHIMSSSMLSTPFSKSHSESNLETTQKLKGSFLNLKKCKSVNTVLPMKDFTIPGNTSGTKDTKQLSDERVTCQSLREANLSFPNVLQGKQARRSERKIVKTLSAILLALIVTFAPYYTTVVVEMFCRGCVNHLLYTVAYWMCYINSTINPFLYALCNAKFQQTFLDVTHCRKRRK